MHHEVAASLYLFHEKNPLIKDINYLTDIRRDL